MLTAERRDLVERLGRLERHIGEPLTELFRRFEFDMLIALVRQHASDATAGSEAEGLEAVLEALRDELFEDLEERIRRHASHEDLAAAETLLKQARALHPNHFDLPSLEYEFNEKRERQRAAARWRRELAQARERAEDTHSLGDLREARSIYASLIEQSRVVGEHLDLEAVEREHRQVRERHTALQAELHEIGTLSQLADLRPKLEAHARLEKMRAAGLYTVTIKGTEEEPIAAVIERTAAELRPLANRLIGDRYDHALKLADDGGRTHAALMQLREMREALPFVSDGLRLRVDQLDARLAAIEERAEAIREVQRQVGDLQREGRVREAIELLEREITRLGDAPPLVEQLSTVRRQVARPLLNRIEQLTTRAQHIMELWPDRIANMAEQAEALAEQVAEAAAVDDGFAAARVQVEALVALLGGLLDVCRLRDAERPERARRVLADLQATLPEAFGLTLSRQAELLAEDREVRRLLDEMRRLYGEAPERAVALGLEHAMRHPRIRELVDVYVVDRARSEAERLERAGQYVEALAVLEAARGTLQDRDHDTLRDAIDRLRRIRRDAPTIRTILASAEQAESENERANVGERLAVLTAGADVEDRVNAIVAAAVPRHIGALRRLLASFRRREAVDLAAIRSHADFLAHYARPPSKEMQRLVGEAAFAERLEEAREGARRGEHEQAIELLRGDLGGPFDGAARGQIMVCRVEVGLAKMRLLLATLDFDRAHAALADLPDNDDVRDARLLVERLDGLVRAMRSPASDAGDGAIAAFGEARALVEARPDAAALRPLLVELARLRVAGTRACLAALEKDDAPGAVLARRSLLLRDRRAAGGEMARELVGLAAEVEQHAARDLAALVEWIEAQSGARQVDPERLAIALERLQAVQRDDPSLDVGACLDAGWSALENALAFERDRAAVERYRAEAWERVDRAPLVEAVAIEQCYADRPFGMTALLDAWDAAERHLAELIALVGREELSGLEPVFAALRPLAAAHRLPRLAVLRIEIADGLILGPGLSVIERQLQQRTASQAEERAETQTRLAQLETEIGHLERRCEDLLRLAQVDDGEVDARAGVATIEEERAAMEASLDQLAAPASRLELAAPVGALRDRLHALRAGVINDRIGAVRDGLTDAIEAMNELRVAPARRPAGWQAQVEALAEQYSHSERMRRWARSFTSGVLSRSPG